MSSLRGSLQETRNVIRVTIHNQLNNKAILTPTTIKNDGNHTKSVKPIINAPTTIGIPAITMVNLISTMIEVKFADYEKSI